MCAIVEAIEGSEESDQKYFTTQQYALPTKPRHKPVTEEELDHLAGKNMAYNTQYQTKWATTVMKGMSNNAKHAFH